MRSPSFLAVDCGASHVAVGRFLRRPGSRPALDRVAIAPLTLRNAPEDAWASGVGAALEEIGRRERLSGPCIVGLPGHLTLSKTIRIPRLPARQRRNIIRFEVSQSLPCPPAEVLWSCTPVAAGPDGEELIITAVRVATMNALCAGLDRAGFHPSYALPAWLVLHERLGAGPSPTAARVTLGIGARSSQLVSCGGTGFFARTIALGGDVVTQGIADQLKVDWERAEFIKRQMGAGGINPPVDAPEDMASQIAADQFIRRLQGEVVRSLACIYPAGQPVQPAILHLTGGGSLLTNLPRALAQGLNLRVERWEDTFGPGGVADTADPEARLEVVRRSDLARLGWCGEQNAGSTTSLLPAGVRHRTRARRWWPGMAAAAVLALVAPLVPIRQARAAALSLRRSCIELDARIAGSRRLEARNRAAVVRLSDVNRRIAALRRVTTARSSWTLFAIDLQERLAKTQDAWLERLRVVPATAPRPTGRTTGTAAEKGTPSAPPSASGPRIILAGCLFDPEHPLAKPGEGAYQRVQSLLADLGGSPFVAAVEDERFDASQTGVLRFEVTVVPAPHALF